MPGQKCVSLVSRNTTLQANEVKPTHVYPLKRVDISSPQHQRGGAEADAWGDKGGGNRSRIKQIWMIANFSQLHQNVDDTHEMACG